MSDEPMQAQAVEGGHWREDGTFQAPEGWPEGAGWVVKNPDGTIDQWGPASDLRLVARVGDGTPADPGDYSIALKGLPEQAEGQE